MINPYLTSDLRRAQRIFIKRCQPVLATAAHTERGRLADAIHPDETEAYRLIQLAFGDPIHA